MNKIIELRKNKKIELQELLAEKAKYNETNDNSARTIWEHQVLLVKIEALENFIKELKEAINSEASPKEEVEEEIFNYNFASRLLDIKVRSKQAISDHFRGVLNDFSILSTYHKDFTISEMIGIIKFISPVILFDDTVSEYNKEHNVKLGRTLRETLDYLRNLEHEETLDRLEKAAKGQFESYCEILKGNIKEYQDKKSKYLLGNLDLEVSAFSLTPDYVFNYIKSSLAERELYRAWKLASDEKEKFKEIYVWKNIDERKTYRPEIVNNIFDEVIDNRFNYGVDNDNKEIVEKRKVNLEAFEKIMSKLNITCSHRTWETSYMYFEQKPEDGNICITSLGNGLAPLLYTITMEDFIEKYKDLTYDDIKGVDKTLDKDYYQYLNTCVDFKAAPIQVTDENWKEDARLLYISAHEKYKKFRDLTGHC